MAKPNAPPTHAVHKDRDPAVVQLESKQEAKGYRPELLLVKTYSGARGVVIKRMSLTLLPVFR